MRIAPLIVCVTFASWVFAGGSADRSAFGKLIEKRTQAPRIASSHTLGDEPLSGYRLRKRGPPQPKPVVATKGGVAALPPAKAQSVTDPKTLSQSATGAKAAAKGAACGRKLPRRSIYDALVARGKEDKAEECDSGAITLTLNTVVNGQTISVTEVIPAGTDNLGAASTGNLGVYQIPKWGTQTGPFIAKRFKDRADMDKEASILNLLCELIASSPEGSTEAWIVMKVMAGQPFLKNSPEWNAVMAKPKPEVDAFMKDKREKLVIKVIEVYHALKGKTHGDLQNKNEHVLWDNQGKCNLIDWGRVWNDDAIMKPLRFWTKGSKTFKVAEKTEPEWQMKNLRTYAEICALSMYPDKA